MLFSGSDFFERVFTTVTAVSCMTTAAVAGGTGTSADSVIEYVPATISSSPLQQNANAALGLPTAIDDGNTTPFTPPFHAASITIIGAGGHVTLHFAQPVANVAGPDFGVYTNTGFVASTSDGTITAATSGSGAAAVFSSDAAIISVSSDNQAWFTLNGGDAFDLTMPSNAFLDTTLALAGGIKASGGTVGSDPYQPFVGNLTQFAGLNYPQMLALFNGSFGGAWVDFAASGLGEVNYVRFDVPAGKRLVLDAVTGASAVPEPASAGLLGVAAALLMLRRPKGAGIFISRNGSFSSGFKGLRGMKCLMGAVAGAGLMVLGTAAAHGEGFAVGGKTYDVEHVAGSGSAHALLELDFGTNASPDPHVMGFQWDPASPPTANGRTMLLGMEGSATTLTFTDTYFAAFDSYFLNTLGYDGTVPPDNYPDSFWYWFTSPLNTGTTWTDSNFGYAGTALENGGIYAWALQHDDPNMGRDFSLPPLPPSHFPAAVVAVPEPMSLGVMMLGMAGLLVRRKR